MTSAKERRPSLGSVPKDGTTGNLRVLVRAGKGRGLAAVGLLFLSGLAEGVGVFSLLPLLSLAQPGTADEQGGREENLLTELIGTLGLEPTVGTLLLVLVLATMVKAALFVLAMRQVGFVAADVATGLRLDLLQSLTRARWTYLTSRPSGAFVNAMGTEAMRVSQLFTETSFLLAMAIQVAVYSAAALVISWQATVAAVIFGGLLLMALRSFVRMSARAGKGETEILKSLSTRMGSVLGVMKPVKAMAREEALRPVLEAETRELNAVYRRQVTSKALLIALQEPFIAVVLGLGFFVALRSGYAMNELLVMAFVFYRIITRLGSAQSHAQGAATVRSAYVSILEMVAAARAMAEPMPGTRTPTLNSGIEFQDVSFSYDDHQVFDGLSLRIDAGSLTAIVGPSGGGKTSLVDLVVGLIQPSAGSILVDGVPLTEMNLLKWRAQIGYVSQEVILLHDTVAMNVSLGAPDVDSAAIERALRVSLAWDFVQKLPHGSETMVGERGLSLSGGQRQRIAIARAILHLPLLLILDEATSALDPETEAQVLENLRASREITTLSISHQPLISKLADRTYTVGNSFRP